MRGRRITIWALVSHALILIGLGHGIATLGILEGVWLWKMFEQVGGSSGIDNEELGLRIVAVLCLVGQSATIWSMVMHREKLARIMHLAGMIALWSSVLAYAYFTWDDSYAHLAGVTCIPFAVLSVWSVIVRFRANSAVTDNFN